LKSVTANGSGSFSTNVTFPAGAAIGKRDDQRQGRDHRADDDQDVT